MRRSSRLAAPLRRPEDVIPHLGERHHGKQAHSAHALVDDSGLTIAELRQTTLVSPSQWEGSLVDGRPLYIRYRWGELSVWIGRKGEDVDRMLDGKPWFWGAVGDRMASAIELPQVLQATGLSLSPGIEDAA